LEWRREWLKWKNYPGIFIDARDSKIKRRMIGVEGMMKHMFRLLDVLIRNYIMKLLLRIVKCMKC